VRIDIDRTGHNLSSAVRLFVLDYFRMRTNHETFASTDLTAGRIGPAL
jgi:predicted DNA-binding ribbon-helix-helix protein